MQEYTLEEKVSSLTDEVSAMTQFAKEKIPLSQPDLLARRLTEISSFMARTGEIFAISRLLMTEHEQLVRSVMSEEIASLKATEQKRIISYKTRKTQYLIDLTERLNHELVNIGNNIRKQIQYNIDQIRNLPSS